MTVPPVRVSPRIYYGLAVAAAMSLAAFALCVTANKLLAWAVYWLAAFVVGVTLTGGTGG